MKKKCKVIMLPANEKAIRKGQIGFVKENTWIGTCSNVELDNIAVNQGDVVPQHLYIISDEEIKVGDLCYSINFKGTYVARISEGDFVSKENFNKYAKKIIASTDESLCRKVWKHTNKKSKPYNIQSNIETTKLISVSFPRPSPGFVEVFIREYNKGNVIQNVMVEYDAYNRSTTWEYDKPEIIELKVDKNNYITITREKESWSREEVINLCRKIQDETAKYKRSCHYGPNLRELNEWTDDWIEQNL